MNLAFIILNTDEIHSSIITTDFVHIFLLRATGYEQCALLKTHNSKLVT